MGQKKDMYKTEKNGSQAPDRWYREKLTKCRQAVENRQTFRSDREYKDTIQLFTTPQLTE